MVKKDEMKAIKYFEIAAKNGHADACYHLGVTYSNGIHGVERDINKGLYYYKQGLYKIGILFTSKIFFFL